MKKILTFLAFVSLTATTPSFAQFQANVRADGNRIIFSIRPNTNVSQIGFSTIEFFLRYPAATPAFAYGDLIENTTNFPGIGNFKVVAEPQVDGFKIDHFIYTAPEVITPKKDFAANVIYDILSVDLIGTPNVIAEMQFVHKDNEDPFYLVITDGVGQDARSGSSNTLFFPTTTTEGSGANTIYKMSLANVPVPVKFLSFFALKSGDDAKLNWTVENDTENRYFELERSTDGRSFKTFSKVEALGNGKTVNNYSSSDLQLSKMGSKSIYYRIKQVDKDGTSTYSTIRTIGVERFGVAVNLYPNPARSITKLVYEAEKPGRGNVLIRDMNGKLITQVATQFVAGINQQELNVTALPAGDYNVSITGTGYNHVVKLTKIY